MSSSGAEDGGSERGSAEDGDDDVDMSGGGGGGEVRKDGAVTLSLLDVNPMLVCSICDGYFRDAHTIVECLHTYCKQCIVAEFARSTGKTFACPRCGTQLGGNPMSGTLPDRTMQSVVDSILPIFVVRDAAALAEAGGGAIRQRDSGAAAAGGRRKHRHNSSRSHDIRLSIVPSDPDAVDADTMKKLRYLRTSNKIRVAQLKRYLALVLGGLARVSRAARRASSRSLQCLTVRGLCMCVLCARGRRAIWSCRAISSCWGTSGLWNSSTRRAGFENTLETLCCTSAMSWTVA